MQVFELHFNPGLREDQIFDSFVYEPENVYERKLGSLYMAGELRNTLPQNLKFLDNLVKITKKNYYTLSSQSPEKALSQSLKRANEFLAEEVKKENVSWLGNLNFAILALKDFNLIFTKTGDLKILLLRTGQIIDIGKNLDLREIEPYPLKIFLNVVSGKLAQNDLILVLTKEVFEFFHQQNILTKLAQAENLNSKKIKEILPSSLFTEGEGSKVSGICFLSVVKTEAVKKARLRPPAFGGQARKIRFQKEEKFSFSQTFSPIPKLFKSVSKILKSPIKFLSPVEKFRLATRHKVFFRKPLSKFFYGVRKTRFLKRPTQKITKGKIPTRRLFLKRKLVLILALILFLFVGFLIFKKAEERREGEIKASLTKIEEKMAQAENFLIFKNEEKANSLFKKAWGEILPLTEKETSLRSDILSLKQSIEENLKNLNKSETIENPEIIAEPDPNLFSSPSNSLVDPPPFNFNFDLSASYLSNLYFLDKKTCEIIKYPYLSKSKWGAPKKWMKDKGPCSEPKSMTIDGSVWILNQDNSIILYRLGSYQETITLDFFPFPENITKIETKPDIPYLYLLEPVKQRVIIIDKEGKIIKQFQSQKFDNLKDIAISDDGKTIYLLNDSKIYKIRTMPR